MESQKANRFEQFKKLLENLIQSGVNEYFALNFIEENVDILVRKDKDVNDSIFFLFNNQDIYGLVFVDGDKYYWSTLIDGEFTKLKAVSEEDSLDVETSDFIVEMIIRFADSDKIKNIIPEISTFTIENKLRTLKTLGLNENGYHIK